MIQRLSQQGIQIDAVRKLPVPPVRICLPARGLRHAAGQGPAQPGAPECFVVMCLVTASVPAIMSGRRGAIRLMTAGRDHSHEGEF
jgi:hypothetical protein